MNIQAAFNAGVVCHAIATADRLGILDVLEDRRSVIVSNLVDGGLGRNAVNSLLGVLQGAGIVTVTANELVEPGDRFAECASRKALFTWLFHASSAVLVSGPGLIQGTENLPRRDGALVGSAMADLGRRHVDRALYSAADWGKFKCLLDVGCGDASRLQAICSEFGISGIGLDLSEAAIAAGKERMGNSGGMDDIRLIHGNALTMEFDETQQGRVDVALVSFLAHDLLPEDEAIRTLKLWNNRLPNLRRMVICETVRAEVPKSDLEAREVPEVGYEFLHSLMGVELATDAAWRAIFSAAGWTVGHVARLEIPANTMIYVCDRDLEA